MLTYIELEQERLDREVAYAMGEARAMMDTFDSVEEAFQDWIKSESMDEMASQWRFWDFREGWYGGRGE